MEGRYCAYLRKSRADALRERMEDGYDALAHHRRALEELAARLGVEVSRWYRDGIKSGDSIAARAVKLRECVAAIRDPQVDGESKRLLIWALVDRIEYQNRAPVGKDDIRLDIRMR